MPVAIVGIGCRFPGGVDGPASFWRLLENKVDAITEIPRDRFDLARYFDPTPATPGRVMTRWGGFLSDIDRFDADFFGISPREAERLDPQQRLLLETAWEALEDAGQDVRRLEGSNTGVFVGQWLSDFEGAAIRRPGGCRFLHDDRQRPLRRVGAHLVRARAARPEPDDRHGVLVVARRDPSGVRSVRSGESELALAGGVNVILQPHISIAYSQSRMMAADGRCKFGDAAGDGYVRSEGAGLVVLKPLERALADGDRIYAVIRGSAINNDGRSSGVDGHAEPARPRRAVAQRIRDAGVPPARVGYVEAHGTGTRAGDPVELAALGAVLGEGRTPGHQAFVGSVKTNIGHTEGAAGVAGLIKAALALHHARSRRACIAARAESGHRLGRHCRRHPRARRRFGRRRGRRSPASARSASPAPTRTSCSRRRRNRRTEASSRARCQLLPLSATQPAQRCARWPRATPIVLETRRSDDTRATSAGTRPRGAPPLDHRAVFVATDRDSDDRRAPALCGRRRRRRPKGAVGDRRSDSADRLRLSRPGRPMGGHGARTAGARAGVPRRAATRAMRPRSMWSTGRIVEQLAP